ncbi:MAG: hypothetical protein JXL97_05205, partial [Bacteroidales bacterium]|nr:hypothetical protein [Bacteroidales bacterium]
SFASVDDYEKALTFLAKDEQNDFAEWNKMADFSSMAKAYKNNKAEMPADDDILANFLNAESVVEIQGQIFKLDFKKEIVLVYENYKSFIYNKYSKTYSFDDEVLTLEFCEANLLAKTGEVLQNDCGCKGTYCNDYNAGDATINVPSYGWVKYNIKYLKYGIYYTLVTNSWKQSYDQRLKQNLTFTYNYQYNGGGGDNSEFKDGYNKSYTIRGYAMRFRLTDYDMIADFIIHDYGQVPSWWNSYSWSHSCVK